MIPYIGISYDLTLRNSKLPLGKQASYRNFRTRLRRLSFNMGVLMRKVGDDDRNTRDDLVDDYSLMTGMAFGFTQATRLGFGLIYFMKEEENPLTDEREVGVDFYVSLSYDYTAGLDKLTFTNLAQWLGAAGALVTRLAQ